MLASDPVQHCRAVAAPLGDMRSPKQSVVAKHSTAQSVRACVFVCEYKETCRHATSATTVRVKGN